MIPTRDEEAQHQVDELYPDLGQKYSAEERAFLAQIANNSPPKMSQMAHQIPPQQSQEPVLMQPPQPVAHKQQIKMHVIRSLKAWKDIVKQTLDWANSNIHPMRIISLSVVLCHSTTAGQVTIFYDDSKSQFMRQKILPFVQYALAAIIVDTGKSWERHHKDVMNSIAQFSAGGAVIAVSELETKITHNRATSIIWFLRKY